MKVNELILYGTKSLAQAQIESARLDAKLLFCKAFNKDKIFLITNKDDDIAEYGEYEKLLNRRKMHEPMQYILGKAEFMGLEFYVDSNVLIPRPDTEALVEKVIDEIADSKKTILEIGTGSGCIPISILHFCKNAKAFAMDISKYAISVAEKNAKSNGVGNRIEFINGDVFKDFPNIKVDGIVSNPPYIEDDVVPTLMTDVKDYEPQIALLGGKDGLDFYRHITKIGYDVINDGGFIAYEVGYNQSEAVKEILEDNNFKNIGFCKDIAGINRVVYGYKIK